MIFTITDTETNLKQLIDDEGYVISDQRFNNKISFWITNGTKGSSLFVSGAGVLKNGILEPLQTDTKPIAEGETIVYEELSTRLNKIRLQALTGQTITVYVDIRL